MKTFLKWLVLVPVGIVLLVFAIVNRHSITVTFDPFEAGTPQLQVTAPLFIVMFAAIAVGVIVGGCTTWLLQGRHRRAGAKARGETARLQAEVEQLRAQMRNFAPSSNRALTNRNAA